VQGVLESGGFTASPVLAATFGTPGGYGNLALAPPPVGAARGGEFESGALAASGGFAATDWLLLFGEAWAGQHVGGGTSLLFGAAARLHWGIGAVEIGGYLRGSASTYVFASLVVDANPFRAAEVP
jgi:hypothetical protein